MPNWCYTQAYIHSKKAKKIYDELKKATTTHSDPEIWRGATNWLGYLLTHIGIDNETRRCRGEVTNLEYDHEFEEVRLDTYTAWTSMVDVIEDFAKHYDPEAKVLYTEEESGTLIYWTNDPDEVGNYAYEPDEDEELNEDEKFTFVSINEIREWNTYEKGE